ncbi:hypothetical protein HMPREF1545_02628 [Oscillibacter sp. KLE 1728]|nr:hypothetical protein HMPREF1545_02628 [Oscillibacter sp. KLE 1728]ERK59691.1 hypothetical protein HMPREF1546_03279 [Oscillibacter sp. KLE 1745]
MASLPWLKIAIAVLLGLLQRFFWGTYPQNCLLDMGSQNGL